MLAVPVKLTFMTSQAARHEAERVHQFQSDFSFRRHRSLKRSSREEQGLLSH